MGKAIMIKLMILDVDGIMTDGKKYYGPDGMPCMKTYCDKDFTAIKRVKASGVSVCFLSGDDFINKQMAKNRNIDFYSARNKQKEDFIPHFKQKYNCTELNMLYIGDDLFDVNILKLVKYAYCPSDACKEVKDVCKPEGTLKNRGGNNVVAELVECLLRDGLVRDSSMLQIQELDRKEKF